MLVLETRVLGLTKLWARFFEYKYWSGGENECAGAWETEYQIVLAFHV